MYTLRFLVVLLFTGMAITAAAQDFKIPDMKQIEKDIRNSQSPYFFATLIERFRAGDTTMTLEQKRHLYYGYSFKDDYEPYGSGHFADSVRNLLQKDSLTGADYQLLLQYTDSAVKQSPFDTRMLKYRFYAARKTGKQELMQTIKNRINIITDAIVSTGDGKSSKTGIWVTGVADEYFIIDMMGLEWGGSQSLTDGPCDYLTIKENRWGIKGLYFNVSISMGNLEKMFKDMK